MSRYFPQVWLNSLAELINDGRQVAPRGRKTLEILQRTTVTAMRQPVLNIPQRKLNYKFMAAEAYWILTGDNRVSSISKYNKNIAQFSDDGEVFYGAYGPRILDQLDYVVNCLLNDIDSRQAGLTIWRENPQKTKDVPCTVAIFCYVRDSNFGPNQKDLHLSVYMRSNDIWLGTPYDVFNFSMLGHAICAKFNAKSNGVQIAPGDLFLTAGSSHIYLDNVPMATEVLGTDPRDRHMNQRQTEFKTYNDFNYLLDLLRNVRESSPGDAIRWWEI